MICREGEKLDVRMEVDLVSGSGTWALTTPQYRILTSARAVASGYDWADATWDSTALELYALFDSTIAALSTPGLYYMQFRGTIGAERVGGEVLVNVIEWGP